MAGMAEFLARVEASGTAAGASGMGVEVSGVAVEASGTAAGAAGMAGLVEGGPVVVWPGCGLVVRGLERRRRRAAAGGVIAVRFGYGGRELRGRGLRFLLLDVLLRRGQASVGEMVEVLVEQGHVFRGRPSKVVSDALRWEVGHGRVVRVARGVYRVGRVARSRVRRVGILAVRSAVWFGSMRRRVVPAPFPYDPREPWPLQRCSQRSPCRGSWPCSCGLEPPWSDLRWLWAL
jgi:hypothetical protein